MDASLAEEVLLDENAQAQKHSFYMVRGFEVSKTVCARDGSFALKLAKYVSVPAR